MKKIQIYSTKTCPWCFKAKDFFTDNNIDYEDIDVGMNQDAAKEMVDKSGQMGVPVIDIDGEVIVGFDQNRIEKTLNIGS